MVEVIEFFTILAQAYQEFISGLIFWQQNFINLFLLVCLVVIYAIFVWKLYRFIAKKNILPFNIGRFHIENKHGYNKFVSAIGYFIKNIVIFPVLIFFWYAIFTIFLMVLAENLPIKHILMVAAIIIASIRATSYYREGLSKDLAKLLPLTLLAVFLMGSSTFNFGNILSNLSAIPSFLGEITIFYLFILALEVILRIIDLFFVTSGIDKQDEILEGIEEE